MAGTVLDGRYQLSSVIGEGATGCVYRAQQLDGGSVAVKVLHDSFGNDSELRERFEREARALFGISHPNVLGVHDFGIESGVPYLVMELLEGMTLDQYVEEHPPGPVEALRIAVQFLQGLAFAHAQGVLHRDLKTENIFITRSPQGDTVAKLLDFGLVKFIDDERWGASATLTAAGAVMGTPAYMSPEQCTGARVDARSDVYSAGVILFELFTGVWPFMEESRLNMFQAHLAHAPPSLNEASDRYVYVPRLDEIVKKTLAKRREDRYPSAQELLAAVLELPRPVGQPRHAAAGGAAQIDRAAGLDQVNGGDLDLGNDAEFNRGSLPWLWIGAGVLALLAVAWLTRFFE